MRDGERLNSAGEPRIFMMLSESLQSTWTASLWRSHGSPLSITAHLTTWRAAQDEPTAAFRAVAHALVSANTQPEWESSAPPHPPPRVSVQTAAGGAHPQLDAWAPWTGSSQHYLASVRRVPSQESWSSTWQLTTTWEGVQMEWGRRRNERYYTWWEVTSLKTI